MAGHSKFANIRHRKGAQDAKRGKLFTKLIREITVAARLGGGDVSSNPRLRDAIEKANKANMTKDTVERAIKRGEGSETDQALQEIQYEGYGPAGVAVIVACLTDNRNRTVADVRTVFSKCGGNLGTDGSVSYLFEPCGLLFFQASQVDNDALFEQALEAGAQDVVTEADGSIEVRTAFEDFHAVKEALEKAGFKAEEAELTQLASTSVAINDKDTADKLMTFIDKLDDLDDVQQVFTNADIDDAI